MDYNENYMMTHDIDWFCIVNGVYVHLASAGGILPRGFRNRESLRTLQNRIANVPLVCGENDVMYNEDFLSQRFENNPKGRASYLVTFKEMAQKGFVSMDRTNLNDSSDNHYHIVCYPKNRDIRVFEGMAIPILDNNEMLSLDLQLLRLME